MFHRQRFEQEYHPMYQAPYRMGTTIWSQLKSGILTGKYNTEIPDDSRLTQPGYEFLRKELEACKANGTLDKIRELTEFAKTELGCSMTQLALAWCLKNPNVTTILLGATKPSQLEENLGALEVAKNMTDAQLAKVEEVLGNKPEVYSGFGGGGWQRRLHTL